MLAIIVGILLTVLVFVAVPLKYFPDEGTSTQVFGENLTSIVGVVHGWIYIAYVAVAFFLSRRVKWGPGFTVLVLLLFGLDGDLRMVTNAGGLNNSGNDPSGAGNSAKIAAPSAPGINSAGTANSSGSPATTGSSMTTGSARSGAASRHRRCSGG